MVHQYNNGVLICPTTIVAIRLYRKRSVHMLAIFSFISQVELSELYYHFNHMQMIQNMVKRSNVLHIRHTYSTELQHTCNIQDSTRHESYTRLHKVVQLDQDALDDLYRESVNGHWRVVAAQLRISTQQWAEHIAHSSA